jgi:hypothetical protein
MVTMFDGQVTAGFDVGVVSDKSLSAIRAATRKRGILSREEAEFLFLIDRTGFIGGPDWFPDAVKAVASYVVWDRSPSGRVTEEDCDWLIGLVGDQPTAFGRAVLFQVVREAEESLPRIAELVMRASVGRCLLV